MKTSIYFWSTTGLLFTIFSFYVFGTWALSTEFAAVPISASDAMDAGAVMKLRALESISVAVAIGVLFGYLIIPWLRTGHAPIAGLLLVGALVTYVLDTAINYSDYHMAWNKHAFNVGTWASFVPGHTGPTRYAEALLWGPPMYMYFGVALATIQYWTFRATCKLGKVLALLLAFVVAFVFDLVVESAIIQTTHAYSWSFTIGALSIWEGTQYQFPLYEALLVAIYGSLYSWLDASARSGDGVSFIERGVQYVPIKLQLLTRFFAATGFAALCTAIYFGGFYAFSQFADSRAELPSYLMPSDEGVHSFR